VTREDVRITGSSTFDGIRTKLVRLHNVTITGTITSTAMQDYYLWTDSCHVIGPGRRVRGDWANGWSGSFHTNSTATAVMNGFAGDLVRGCGVDGIGQIAYQYSGLVVNSTASDIDATGTRWSLWLWLVVHEEVEAGEEERKKKKKKRYVTSSHSSYRTTNQ
jgi:hypothetical protein